MLRKLLLGTTAALALTLGGQAFAANVANQTISANSNDNEIVVDQSTGNNDSAVTIQNNSDNNNVDIDQVNGGDQFSDVFIDAADRSRVQVDQQNNSGTQATITIHNNSFDNGSDADPIAIRQSGNTAAVTGTITINNGNENLASINQTNSDNSTATVTINGSNNAPAPTADPHDTIIQDGVALSTAVVSVTGDRNETTIGQSSGSNLYADIIITNGNDNSAGTLQFGSDHSSLVRITDSSNNGVGVIQLGTNQDSTIDLVNGSNDNNITVGQTTSDNVSTIFLSEAVGNTVDHQQHSVGGFASTTILASSGNNVVVNQN